MSAQPARDATPGDAFARAVRRVKVQRELHPTPGREIVQVLREDQAEPSLHAVPGGDATRPLVVVIGAGFAGMSCVDGLRDTPVDVLLLDEHDYDSHATATYQVASSLLDSSEVPPTPIRAPLHGSADGAGRFAKPRVDHVTQMRQVVLCDTTRITYDTCVSASGSTPNFWRPLGRRTCSHTPLRYFATVDLRRHVTVRASRGSNVPRSDLATTRLRSNFYVLHRRPGPTGVEIAAHSPSFSRSHYPGQYPGSNLGGVRVLLSREPATPTQFDAPLHHRSGRARAARC